MIRFLRSVMIALALGSGLVGLAAAPALAQGSDEAAQIAHWDRVKGSRDPAEVRGYLDKYPSGMFAPLARIRLRNLEGGSAQPSSSAPPSTPSRPSASSTPSTSTPRAPAIPSASSTPPTSAPRPSSTASALTSQDAIREVQDLLYNLNYQVGRRNGRMTSETREAIRQWQTNLKLEVTGDVTEQQLANLRLVRVPTTWGALAYYSKGATATVWNRPTREIAEREALASCRKSAGATCNVLTVANTICGALGFYTANIRGRQHWGAYASVRPTLGQATDNALSECRRQARQPTACGVRTTVCADGGHQR